jgi:membrane associated rhomboid family serine protease
MILKSLTIAAFILLILVFGLYDFFPDSFYLTPRTGNFLFGVLFHPLIHSDINHLVGNLSFLVPCTIIIYKHDPNHGTIIFTAIYLIQGIMLWFTGHNGIHLGCSGVGFGVGFYVLFESLFSFKAKRLLIGACVLFTYYATFSNFMVVMEGIADDSHICGSITGLLVAYSRSQPYFSGAFRK